MEIPLSLLEVLACPVTHKSIRYMSAQELDNLNGRIAEGSVYSVTGSPVKIELVSALITSDGQVAYPVIEGIPLLIPDSGIKLI